MNLQYDQNFFSVSFASVDYLNGNNCTYFYKLKGLSDQWVNNGSESGVSFTNMAPGEYTLLVKYYNSVFDKESDVYSLVIRIGDPWYASWWAYLIYALCLLLLAALLIRSFILRSKRKKQELLNEIEKRHQKNVFESKLRFFTNIAHEFCTPLTLIYGPCGRILSSKGLSKFVVDYVQMIQTNAERLNNLIHELIEFRRIETGNREVRVESLNVSSIVKGIAKTFVEMAKSRNITFLSKIPEQVMWNSDKGFLNTIIINLISNAFKYTPDGQSIKIEVDTSGENMLTLRVANEGSTIKEKDFQYIFNRYAILDNFENQDEKNFSRNGLGLAISYNMAKLLNGTLKVENTPDGWVMFTLTLPVVELTTGVVETKRLTAEYIPNYFSSPISSFEKSDGKLTHKESKKFLQSVLKIINDNITNKDLTPRYIADRLAISPRSLYRKMEEIGEDSPTDLIKECRLHIAKDLLLTTKKTIDEIVFDSGFSNKVTFFKVFREKYECTPKEFRMKHLEEVQQ